MHSHTQEITGCWQGLVVGRVASALDNAELLKALVLMFNTCDVTIDRTRCGNVSEPRECLARLAKACIERAAGCATENCANE